MICVDHKGSLELRQAAAEAFAAADPYAKAGLFSSVSIQPWRIAVGELG
jgi:uncharacterized protein YciI